jgi:hypothetical protein
MKLAFALALSIMAMQAEAADTLGLDKGLFGLSWGESVDAIRSRYPQAVVMAVGDQLVALSVKGNLNFAGHAVEVAVMSFEPKPDRLKVLTFDVQPNEQAALLTQLKSALGEPRVMTTKEGKIYNQIVEWSRPQVSVSLWAVTYGPQLSDAAAMPVTVNVQKGPLDSEIDRAEKQKKELQERFGSGAQKP